MLSGTGQTATQPFSIAGGLTIFAAQCSCRANFAVEIDNATGSRVDIPINVIGSYNGAVAEGLPQGNYVLNITADAPWTVTVSQPRDAAGAALPQTYSGTGQQVVGAFSAGASVRMQSQNTATNGGNFSVEILSSDGSLRDVPFNAIGSFSGSAISNDLSGGPYWLNVDSDGNWTITVSNVTSAVTTPTTSTPVKTNVTPSTSPVTNRVVTASSHSLAFTGSGPGLKTMTLVGAVVMLLGLLMLLLADIPRRALRQLADMSPREWMGRVADGARTMNKATARQGATSPAMIVTQNNRPTTGPADGWYRDPFAIHEERLFKQGMVTPVVRDAGVGSYDEPPELYTRKSGD